MQELIDEIMKVSKVHLGPNCEGFITFTDDELVRLEMQFLEKERQMVIEAVDYVIGQSKIDGDESIGEDYYNEKYKQ